MVGRSRSTHRLIAAKLGGRSASTIRNHRFQLRKRRREARAFLAIMEILDENVEHWDLYEDHTTLKRYLVDYRFLAWERDGSEYWRTDG